MQELINIIFLRSSHRWPLYPAGHWHVNPPKLFGKHWPPFKQGFWAHGSPTEKNNIIYIYIYWNTAIYACIKTCSVRTSFTSWTTKATRTQTLIANISIYRLARSSIHAWITLTCITNFASTSWISWWTYTAKAAIFSHATALIHARLRSTSIT